MPACSARLAKWLTSILAVLAVGATIARGDEPPAPPARPVEVALTTGDGVRLAVTYLAGNQGRKSVPVVLLHDFHHSRRDFKDLAVYLQALGHAVVLPDLRGHGGSTKLASGGTVPASLVTLQAMAAEDLGAIAGFLLDRNNRQELNLDKLCLIGGEMGAAVATIWAAENWQDDAGVGPLGQDVKALVLLSPRMTFRNFKTPDNHKLAEALQNKALTKELSLLLIFGAQNRAAETDANRYDEIFRPHHPQPEKKTDLDLFFLPRDSNLQGSELLFDKQLQIPKIIADFIELRLVKRTFPWRYRGK